VTKLYVLHTGIYDNLMLLEMCNMYTELLW